MIVSVNPSIRNQSGNDMVRQANIYSKQKGRNLHESLLKYFTMYIGHPEEIFSPIESVALKFLG